MAINLKQYFKEDDDAVVGVENYEESGELVSSYLDLVTLESDMQDFTQAVEDLDSIHSLALSMESPTEREVGLLQESVRIAFRGVEADYNLITSSVEDGTVVVSTEALNDTIKRFYEAIVKWMKQIFKYIKDFVDKLFDQTGRLKAQNNNMRKRMEQASKGKIENKKITIGQEINHLSVDNKLPAGPKDVTNGLKELRYQADVIFKDYANSLVQTGDALADAISSYDLSKPEASLQKVFDAACEMNLERLIKLTKGRTVNGPRWKDGSASALQPLPGNKSIFYYFPGVLGTDGLWVKSEARRRKSVTLDDTRKEQTQASKSASMSVFLPSDGYEVHSLNKELLDILTDYHKQYKAIEKAQEKVQKAVVDFEKRYSKNKDTSESSRLYFQEVVKYGQSFTYWTKNPHVSLALQIQRTVRASIMACNQSASNHTP